MENSGDDEKSALTTVVPSEPATHEKQLGFPSKPTDLPLPECETTGETEYLSTSLLACLARNLASLRRIRGISLVAQPGFHIDLPDPLVVFPSAWWSFPLAESQKLPVRIGMGAIMFFLVSQIVILLVILLKKVQSLPRGKPQERDRVFMLNAGSSS